MNQASGATQIKVWDFLQDSRGERESVKDSCWAGGALDASLLCECFLCVRLQQSLTNTVRLPSITCRERWHGEPARRPNRRSDGQLVTFVDTIFLIFSWAWVHFTVTYLRRRSKLQPSVCHTLQLPYRSPSLDHGIKMQQPKHLVWTMASIRHISSCSKTRKNVFPSFHCDKLTLVSRSLFNLMIDWKMCLIFIPLMQSEHFIPSLLHKRGRASLSSASNLARWPLVVSSRGPKQHFPRKLQL